MTLDYFAMDEWWWPFVFILIAGVMTNYAFRFLGVALAGRLKDDSEVFVIVRAIATALVAAVVSQLLFYPSGSLALIPSWLRLLSVIAGFAAFQAARQNLLVGVIAAEVVLIGGWYALVS